MAATLVEEAHVPDGGVFTSHAGRSLAPLLRGEALAPRELYFETYFPRLHFGWSELVGLAQERWKYVEAPGALDAEQRARAELHAPRTDPRESDDRAAAEPDECRALGAALAGLRLALATNAAPSARRTQSSGELDALAALGYGGADVLAHLPGADEVPQPGRDPRLVVGAVTLLNQVRVLANAGRFDESAAALARLVALDPGAVMVDEARGDQALARGRHGERAAFEEAAAAFGSACEREPGRRGLWLRRFEALKALDRLAEALACLDRALELAPPTPEFTRALDELAREVARRAQSGG